MGGEGHASSTISLPTIFPACSARSSSRTARYTPRPVAYSRPKVPCSDMGLPARAHTSQARQRAPSRTRQPRAAQSRSSAPPRGAAPHPGHARVVGQLSEPRMVARRWVPCHWRSPGSLWGPGRGRGSSTGDAGGREALVLRVLVEPVAHHAAAGADLRARDVLRRAHDVAQRLRGARARSAHPQA